ncbi:glycine cleavage T C-terminal barrel domain-containing protein [soil metagenome]
MNKEDLEKYKHIRSGGSGFYEQKRGLIAVWGKEAVQFLDGLISNDMKTLEDGRQMLAAFPNAQGRLLAVVRVMRQGERYLFETEHVTREKLFRNLFRFTFAGDFFVEDMSDQYKYHEVFGSEPGAVATGFLFNSACSTDRFVETADADDFRSDLIATGTVELSDELHELLRIEAGTPKYAFDMDETTIVPELGLDGLISYNKGCYIGQEIIARIHFRGHVAKRLTGLVSEPGAIATGFLPGTDITSVDGKNAGRITSVTFSPKLERTIALAFVRFDFLAAGTKLVVGDSNAVVTDLPFIS